MTNPKTQPSDDKTIIYDKTFEWTERDNAVFNFGRDAERKRILGIINEHKDCGFNTAEDCFTKIKQRINQDAGGKG